MKKILAMLIAAAAMVGVMGITAMAADIAVTDEAELVEALTNAEKGDTINVTGEFALTNDELVIADGVTLIAPGVSGEIYSAPGAAITVDAEKLYLIAGGDLEFKGANKLNRFSLSYYNNTLNIGNGASLEITSTNRVTVGYGNSFIIKGSIDDASKAENVTPSLVIPGGLSITGNGATFDVEDAYISLGLSTSKNSGATDVFDFSFENSIVDFSNNFSFATPTGGKTPTFNITFEDSVINLAKNFDLSHTDCNVVIDNSDVTVGSSFRNDGKFDVINKSNFNVAAQIQAGEHGGNIGVITVDDSVVEIFCSSTGHAVDSKGTGVLIAKNGANVNINHIKDTAIATVGEDVELTYNALGTTSLVNNAVALVDGTFYASFTDALKALEGNSVLTLLDDVTITEKWDVRNTGSTIKVPATIDGNGYTISFENEINDGFNYLTAFRVEAPVTFKNLTIDMSKAVSVFQNRFSAISTKDGDLTVENCTFIGSTEYIKARAIIFGEGGATDEDVITVNGCTFTNWLYGVVDNMNGKDTAAVVTVANSKFTNASINVSATDAITLTGNKLTDSDIKITTYSADIALDVTATDNTFDNGTIEIKKCASFDTDVVEEEVIEALPAVKVETEEGKTAMFSSLNEAVKIYAVELPADDNGSDEGEGEGEGTTPPTPVEIPVIEITAPVANQNVTVPAGKAIVLKGKTASLLADEASALNDVVITVEKGASLEMADLTVTGLSYIYAKEPDSVSVTNCDINVTTVEVVGTNCPPAFVLFSSSNNGSVEFTFVGNKLLATPDATEDWYTYNHGIAGWNSIEKATIKNNVFGSEKAPLGAAAVKLMNFVDDATVEVSGNTFYVESQDTTWGPNAIQFYQNNSRDNDYTVEIKNNEFFVDDATAAIGVNVNGTAGGATVEIATDNTVNGDSIEITDVLVFGNGINDEGATRAYVGIGVEKDANGKIINGWFSSKSLGLQSALAIGYSAYADGSNYFKVTETTANQISVVFEKADVDENGNDNAEDEDLYNIVLLASDDTIINRLNSVDLTFALTQDNGKNDFEIIASNSEIEINPVNNSKFRYEFHYDGKDNVTTDTADRIVIGSVKFVGYGKFTFGVDTTATATNAVYTTTATDNIVDTFIPGGNTSGDNVGELILANANIENVVIVTPTRTLNINIDFPNEITNNDIAYQAMQVKITGEDLEQPLVIDLGTNSKFSVLDVYKNKSGASVTFANDVYGITIENLLTVNTAYTVEVSGAGYRTARYTVTMNCEESKTLNFWNNVKDNAIEIEAGKNKMTTNFLAGDIVKDNNINIYDLSAVVSYFGEIDLVKDGMTQYAKYDLNRDGKIDSKDVAYVLVSWNN